VDLGVAGRHESFEELLLDVAGGLLDLLGLGLEGLDALELHEAEIGNPRPLNSSEELEYK